MLRRLLIALTFLVAFGGVAQAQRTATPQQMAALTWEHAVNEAAPVSLMGEALLRTRATMPEMIAGLDQEGARPATLPETILYIRENAARLRGAHVVVLGSSTRVGEQQTVAGFVPTETGAHALLEPAGTVWPIGTIVIVVRRNEPARSTI